MRDVSACHVAVGVCDMSHLLASIYNLMCLHIRVVSCVFLLVFEFSKIGTNVMVEFVASSDIPLMMTSALQNDVSHQLCPYEKAYRHILLQKSRLKLQ